MIKILQQKLFDSGYISNNLLDKSDRLEINIFLTEALKKHTSESVLAALELFLSKFKERKNLKINNKPAYFKKLMVDFIAVAETPDISFELEITPEIINKTIYEIIDRATTPYSGVENCVNPLKDTAWSDNQFIDLYDEAYIFAYDHMQINHAKYEPLIKKLLELNYVANEGSSIKSEMDEIYSELERIGVKNV